MKKKKHYTLDAINKIQAQYKIILGERSPGKSYAVKKQCLQQAWNNDIFFVYLRRWKDDIKIEKIESYFADMTKNDYGEKEIYNITHGACDCITVYRNGIFLSKTDINSGKVDRIKQVGYAMCLMNDTHYKSMAFASNYKNIIFEEFITDEGYAPKEIKKLTSIVSTVLRRRDGIVYMIGNTLTPVCPYLYEWGLDNVKTQKEGTIDIYHHETLEIDDDTGKPININIAVERCKSNGNGKMFFGEYAKMIDGGEWDTKSYPKLDRDISCYKEYYNIFMSYQNFMFIISLICDYNKNPLLYVKKYEEDEKPVNMRTVTDLYSSDRHTTYRLSQCLNDYDILVNKLLKLRKVCYSDNLVGTIFNQCLADMGEVCN